MQDGACSHTGFLLGAFHLSTPRACTPSIHRCFSAQSGGALALTCSLQGGFGETPHKVSTDLGTEAPGKAQQSLASAIPNPPGKASGMAPHGIPRPSLSAACHAEGTAQKKTASLRRKPASVSIATARDGGYLRGAAWPVFRVPTCPCHPTGRTGCGWVTYYLPGGRRRPPARPPRDAAAWAGGT